MPTSPDPEDDLFFRRIRAGHLRPGNVVVTYSSVRTVAAVDRHRDVSVGGVATDYVVKVTMTDGTIRNFLDYTLVRVECPALFAENMLPAADNPRRFGVKIK